MEKVIPVSDELWNQIKSKSKKVFLRKGDIFVQYGSVNRFTFYISSGSCVCSQASSSGNARVVWFYFHDLFEFLSTPDSFFGEEPTKYELKAFEDSEIIKIHKDTIDELIVSNEHFNRFFVSQILFDFMTVFEARSCLLTYSSSEFLNFILSKYPQIFDRIPSKYIADFIGVTPEWYGKLKKTLDLN